MAVSALQKKIRRYAEVNAARKALEKEEDALKAYFKTEAAGEDAIFPDEAKGLEVVVTREQSVRVDPAAVRAAHGTAFDVTGESLKVVVRTIKEAVA